MNQGPNELPGPAIPWELACSSGDVVSSSLPMFSLSLHARLGRVYSS